MTYCYEQKLGARTVYDKVVTVLQLFKSHGRTGLMKKGDWPDYVDTIRPVYEPEELQAMFKAATEDEATLLKFLLGSGFRDQEIRYVEWKDIDFRHHDVRVKAKPHWRFTPKNWEERVVPLPVGLIERLRKRKEARSATPNQLVFPNGRGKPDSEMDMIVKRVAERAKLNCKQCVTEHNNKCAEGPYCMNFFLHKFRHTFATNHLRDGVDIRTVQAWLGPSRHQIDDGLPQRHPVEGRRAEGQQWRTGGTRGLKFLRPKATLASGFFHFRSWYVWYNSYTYALRLRSSEERTSPSESKARHWF